MRKTINRLLTVSLASLMDFLLRLALPGSRNMGDMKAVPVFITEKPVQQK